MIEITIIALLSLAPTADRVDVFHSGDARQLACAVDREFGCPDPELECSARGTRRQRMVVESFPVGHRLHQVHESVAPGDVLFVKVFPRRVHVDPDGAERPSRHVIGARYRVEG